MGKLYVQYTKGGGKKMAVFVAHKIIEGQDGCTVVLFLDGQLNEFAKELGEGQSEVTRSLEKAIQDYIKDRFSGIKIKTINVMLGSLLIASLQLGGTAYATGVVTNQAQVQTLGIYWVKSQDTLYKIAGIFNTTVSQLKSINNLTGDIIYAGQKLKVPKILTSEIANKLPYGVFKVGARGEEVRRIQNALSALGCSIAEDGIYGGATKAAVLDFQNQYGALSKDGVFGSMTREYLSRGGSSPFVRFVLGFIVMVGALMFLGCPLRMVLRLAGGDLNAVIGLIGFAGGIGLGILFLNKEFTLKRTYTLNKFEGYVLPAVNVGLLILLFIGAFAGIIFFSQKGPGSQHAPIFLALAAGLIVGGFAQRTRLCMVGGIRDLILFKDWYLISGFIAILVTAFIGNAALGYLKVGFAGQPIAHSDGLWNFLGMALAGWGSVLLGGCPLRQLILSGEGNIDSVITVLGMTVGAAFAHNFKLAASAQGPTPFGKIAVILGFIVVLAIGYFNIEKVKDVRIKGDAKLGTAGN